VALLGAYAPSSTALRVTGERKPALHDKAVTLEKKYEYIVITIHVNLPLRPTTTPPKRVWRMWNDIRDE
jgi:hypothetical protein